MPDRETVTVPKVTPDRAHMDHLYDVATSDVRVLHEKEKEYGSSWKKRGGVGAAMMLLRKADRMEVQLSQTGYDVFLAAAKDGRAEGIMDDIRDLRRYLLLVEAELIALGVCASPREIAVHTDADTAENPFGSNDG